MRLTAEEDQAAGATLAELMRACNSVPIVVPHPYHRTWTINAYPLHLLNYYFDHLFTRPVSGTPVKPPAHPIA